MHSSNSPCYRVGRVRCILSCKDVRAETDELEFLKDVFGLAGQRD